MSFYLTVDVGGTSIKYAIVDEKYNICKKDKTTTPPCIEDFLQCMENVYTEVSKKYKIDGISFSVPGTVEASAGRIKSGGCVQYLKDFALVDYMHNLSSTKVCIENDAVCAAMAELECGSLNGCNDALVIVFGTGIGAAVIMNGKIRRGVHDACGELSFIIMGAGFYNEETLWSADNGDYYLRQLVSEMKHIPIEQLDGRKIFEMAENGDTEVDIIIKNYTRLISRNVFNLQAVLDVEKVAVGGGISAQPLFINGIKEGLDSYYSMVDSPIVLPEVVSCRYTGDANLIGAAVNLLNK